MSKRIIRQATEQDIDRVAEIYEHIHDAEEAGEAFPGWVRGVYPTRQTAVDSVARGELYVEEEDGMIVATARFNQEQEDAYKEANWQYAAADEEVLVLHTLVVDPKLRGKGYGAEFLRFYEELALSRKCPYLRMDTQRQNAPARKFYHGLGFAEVGEVMCNFNGIMAVCLICLEKKL